MVRVAFYGSTTTADGAEEEILQQFRACDERLHPGEEIIAVYFDAGRPRGRSQVDLPDGFGLERDGGLVELSIDVGEARRSFDLVVVASAECLSEHPRIYLQALHELLTAGVPVRLGGDRPVSSFGLARG